MAANKRGTLIDLQQVISSKNPEISTLDTRDLSGPHSLQISRIRPGSRRPEQRLLQTNCKKDDPKTGLKDLTIVKAAEAGVRAINYIATNHISPWDIFQSVYELNLDDFMTIATRGKYPHDVVMIKRFSGRNVSAKLATMNNLIHENFLSPLECFHFESITYIVFDYVPICLDQIVASPSYPTELQLAAILGQVLDGIEFLASKGLRHGFMSCSTVLLDLHGVVKISGQEHCTRLESQDQANEDINALGSIAMELMQKYPKDNGAIGVDDLARWPSDSDAVGFLSMTTSAVSTEQLIQHPLLQRPWRKEHLKGMVALSQISVARRFKFLQ